jgi:N-formylglutamate amidohydrolase
MADLSEPPFYRTGPAEPASPVVLSVPHAGRDYSAALLGASRLPRGSLETLEDRLVDRLVWRAVASGCVAVIARVPRAEIDLNRDERELDPALIAPPPPLAGLIQSARTRGGLGLIPTRIAGAGAIWTQRIRSEELRRRIDQVHRPYHRALEAELDAARRRFGVAVLLDCHSMPPRTQGLSDNGRAVVFGDRHGTTMAPDLLEAAAATAKTLGFAVSRNDPYAGGYVVSRHGHPEAGVHAIQLEIDRASYLDPTLREPGPGFDEAARLIERIAGALAVRALDPPQAMAAE